MTGWTIGGKRWQRATAAPECARACQQACLLACLLGGCASVPADHFHTLGSLPVSRSVQPGAPPAAAPGVRYIDMRPVSVPARLRRAQLVVVSADGGLEIRDHQRWASPLADEIGDALSVAITTDLSAVNVGRTARPPGAEVYRIDVDVRRLESAAGSYVLLDTSWSVQAMRSGAVLSCRMVDRRDVPPGYPAMVSGHRSALASLAGSISGAIRDLDGGRPAACP